jgi:hypothetical protein
MIVKKRECAVLHKVNTTGWFTGCSESESKRNHKTADLFQAVTEWVHPCLKADPVHLAILVLK